MASDDASDVTMDEAAGWQPLLDSLDALQACELLGEEALARLPAASLDAAASRYASLGASTLGLLQSSLELHRAVEQAGDSTRGSEPLPPLEPADVLPAHVFGPELAPLQLPLYERVMGVQNVRRSAPVHSLRARHPRAFRAAGWVRQVSRGHGTLRPRRR